MLQGLRQGWHALSVLLLWTVCTCAQAQQLSTHFQVDVGAGHETQTSPLFQLSPESTIIYPGDLNRLSGSHWLTNLQSQTEWADEHGTTAALSATANLKRSFSNPDFDFMALSLQPSVHIPFIGASSVGVGLSLQTTEVAHTHFRDTTGVQLDWTRADGDNLWATVLEHALYRHEGQFSDLDASAQSLVVVRQFGNPVRGIDSLDFTAILGRETNAHGYDDLSQTSAMLTVALRWKGLGADWSGSKAWRQANFADSAFPGEPRREDRTGYFDLSAQWPLSPRWSVRLDYTEAHNSSTTALYDNVYRQLSVLLRSSY